MRVAVLSDIQSHEVTEHLREGVRLALEFEPDLILLPGDLLQCEGVAARERGIAEFRELLAPLEGTSSHVSRGLGAERNSAPRVRFNCPPGL